MKKNSGFTLIEILIALAIFALLASITSSTLYYAFNTRTRVNAQAERLSELQMAISIIQQETSQTIERSIQGNDQHNFPIFTGLTHYLEFTHDGMLNPLSQEKRSTLKRIALLCQEGKLIHRTWASLDPVDRKEYQDKILLDKLDNCYFNYLNQEMQLLEAWREQALTQNQNKAHLPKAIQINLNLHKWGVINLLFIIPGALYAGA